MKRLLKTEEHDFTRGSVAGNILRLAIPMTLAQFINMLYNVIDRMYIGRIPQAGPLALTGVGVAFPIITGVTAFANLYGTGGAPLCSIARGHKEEEKAEEIIGNTFSLLVITGILLTIICLLAKRPVLYAFGASDTTFPYADAYTKIYLLGSIFVMISLGMNGFINAQGFAEIGMGTVLVGAVLNIILDPLFIFVFHLGVEGAAIATVLSQFVSAAWVLRFLTGKKTLLKLRIPNLRLRLGMVKEIVGLGLSGFCMSFTNCAVQVVCNITLQAHGGDVYVGVMTIINSVREILTVPVMGFTQGAQPVLGYNFGAGKYQRVKTGIKFMSVTCIVYTTAMWGITLLLPGGFIRLFNGSQAMLTLGIPAMQVYFFGFCFMSLQFSGQSVFTGLGKAKQAIFFSLLRKAVIVIPLTILLPYVGNLGAMGVFLAEPVSNFLGGTACFITMMCTVWPSLSKACAEP